jgi:hypothetical protein
MSVSTKSPGQFTPAAALLAWLWPGLGHISLGERKRGLFIMIGVLFLFLGGVLIGGIDSVDRRDDRLWFLAQALCGPIALVVDFANQALLEPLPQNVGDRYLRGEPATLRRLELTGLSRVNEMGTLFSALAGLMNLAVILDALHSKPRGPTLQPAVT